MWTALSILLALAFLQNAQAGVYRVRDDDGASPLVLFRDTDQPGIFYFLPTAYNLVARSGTGRGLGIQFFSDAKAKEKIGVSVTLSVASGISPAQLLSASDFLRQRFGLADPRLVPIPKQLTRISIYGDGSPTTPLAATRWNSTTSDSTQSLSFTVSNITKQDALRLLSADAGGLVILVETQVDAVFTTVASARISPAKLAELTERRGAVLPGSDFEKFVDEVLERAVETTLGDRAVVRDNVASWLRVRLGAPIAFRSKDQMVYGWSLGKTLPFRQDESSIRVLLGGPRTEFFGAFLEFGNLCRSSAAVILNLDDGSPGCDSLK